MTYALLVQSLNGEQREQFDRDLNGYTEKDDRALAALFDVSPSDEGGDV